MQQMLFILYCQTTKAAEHSELKTFDSCLFITFISQEGNKNLILCSYPNLPRDVSPGCTILCADGSITLKVLSCDVEKGIVKCRCENNAKLGEKKNMNLPGVVVDLPTITEKDQDVRAKAVWHQWCSCEY